MHLGARLKPGHLLPRATGALAQGTGLSGPDHRRGHDGKDPEGQGIGRKYIRMGNRMHIIAGHVTLHVPQAQMKPGVVLAGLLAQHFGQGAGLGFPQALGARGGLLAQVRAIEDGQVFPLKQAQGLLCHPLGLLPGGGVLSDAAGHVPQDLADKAGIQHALVLFPGRKGPHPKAVLRGSAGDFHALSPAVPGAVTPQDPGLVLPVAVHQLIALHAALGPGVVQGEGEAVYGPVVHDDLQGILPARQKGLVPHVVQKPLAVCAPIGHAQGDGPAFPLQRHQGPDAVHFLALGVHRLAHGPGKAGQVSVAPLGEDIPQQRGQLPLPGGEPAEGGGGIPLLLPGFQFGLGGKGPAQGHKQRQKQANPLFHRKILLSGNEMMRKSKGLCLPNEAACRNLPFFLGDSGPVAPARALWYNGPDRNGRREGHAAASSAFPVPGGRPPAGYGAAAEPLRQAAPPPRKPAAVRGPGKAQRRRQG